MSNFVRLLDRVQHRVAETIVDMLGVTSTFDNLFAFEHKYGFLYTRSKGKDKLGYAPNLKTPRSFNEKSIHRRLFSRDPVWPIVSNKALVQQWLTDKGLHQGLEFIPAPYVVDDIDSFEFEKIDEPVVIKAAWASGLNLFVREPRSEHWDSIRTRLRNWQGMVYFPKRLVWAETQMKRTFVIEKMLSNLPGGMLDDYKFYVFHGRVELLQVISDRQNTPTYRHYDRDLNRLTQLSRAGKREGQGHLDNKVQDMIPLVEQLGKHFDFVRVDLYLLEDKILFGEFTQCPANGFAAFSSSQFDFELGEKWHYDYNGVYNSFLQSGTFSGKPAAL